VTANIVNAMQALRDIKNPGTKKKLTQCKVREVSTLGDNITLVVSDRSSSLFDVILPDYDSV